MTGRLNRASGLLAQPMLLRLLDHEAAQAQRLNTPMAVIRLSVQLEAHLDEATARIAHQMLAQLLNTQLRAIDLPGHLEDEYLIILPLTTEASGRVLAGRLARAFADLSPPARFQPALCAGLAAHPGGPTCNGDMLADQATAALRLAQRLGPHYIVGHSELAQAQRPAPKPRILITRRIPQAGVARPLPHCDIAQWEPDLPMPRDELLRQVANVEGLYSLLTDRVDAELLDAAPGLKVVSNMAVGFDNVDVAECTRRGLPVGNTPGVLTDTTADLAFTLMCAAARRVVEGAEFVQDGQWKTWSPMLMLGQDVHGATLGIVGLGRIGLTVARRARGFDMRILYYDPDRHEAAEHELGVEYRDLEALLAEADFVSLHTPLTTATRGLINARRLRQMKPTATLVNTSRGPVVDTEALVEALRDGIIGAAALDVTDPEPLPADHPLLRLPNCVVVPHIASASVATRDKMATMAAENLLAGLRGERLPNCVNPEVYSH